jgi:hypothetical protein
MFNLGLGELTVMALLLVIFLGPGKLPDLINTTKRRPRRRGFVQPVHEVRPLSGLDWALLTIGFALVFAVLALLARR